MATLAAISGNTMGLNFPTLNPGLANIGEEAQ